MEKCLKIKENNESFTIKYELELVVNKASTTGSQYSLFIISTPRQCQNRKLDTVDNSTFYLFQH